MDIEKQPSLPVHPRITDLTGSSTAPEIVRQIQALIKPGEKVIVSLDSDHHKQHVLDEVGIYSKMFTPGQYLVVEDTDVNGHRVFPGFGPGPWQAVADFLKENHSFRPDPAREKFLVTFYPGGWLKRIEWPGTHACVRARWPLPAAGYWYGPRLFSVSRMPRPAGEASATLRSGPLYTLLHRLH